MSILLEQIVNEPILCVVCCNCAKFDPIGTWANPALRVKVPTGAIAGPSRYAARMLKFFLAFCQIHAHSTIESPHYLPQWYTSLTITRPPDPVSSLLNRRSRQQQQKKKSVLTVCDTKNKNATSTPVSTPQSVKRDWFALYFVPSTPTWHRFSGPHH